MEFDSHLITCGGRTAEGVVDTVEIFQLHSGEYGKWYITHPLPFPCYNMSYTIIQGTCYLLGGITKYGRGTNKIVHASLASLLEASGECESARHWYELKGDVSDSRAAVASLNNNLLAIGGIPVWKPKIRCYQHMNRTWFELDDLPDPNVCVGSAVAKLPSDELLIIGGATNSFVPYSVVYKGTLTCNK